MKHSTLKSLLFIFCFTLASCGNEFDSYKDKVLEHTANELNTTKELLVKDLDIKFDSMSISYLHVEDSICILEEIYKENIAKQEEKIAAQKNSIERRKKENEGRKKDYLSSIFTSMNNQHIKEAERQIKEIEEKIQKITDDYHSELEKFEERDKKERIYNVFRYQISFIIPKTEMHQIIKGIDLFTPDGQTYINSASNRIKDYLDSKQSQ